MPQVKISINEELYQKIKDNATINYRTITAEINYMLTHAYKAGAGIITTPALSYPPGVKGIPEHPYKITATAGLSQPVFTETTTTYYPDEKTIKIKPKAERNKYCTVSEHPTGNRTADGHKKHPLVWLNENVPNPMDTTRDTFDVFKQFYPDVNIQEFDKYQQDRRNKYTPDPTDPFDPTIGNPYLKNK